MDGEGDNDVRSSGVNMQLQRAYREKHTLLSEIQSLKNELKKQKVVSSSGNSDLPLHVLLNESIRAATMTCMWAMRCQIIKREALAFHRWLRIISSPNYEKAELHNHYQHSTTLLPEQKRASLLSEAFGLLNKREDQSPSKGNTQYTVAQPVSTRTHYNAAQTAVNSVSEDDPYAHTEFRADPNGGEAGLGPASPPKQDVTSAAADLITFLKLSQQAREGLADGAQEYDANRHRQDPLSTTTSGPKSGGRQGRSENRRNHSLHTDAHASCGLGDSNDDVDNAAVSSSYQFVRPTRRIATSSSLLQATQSSRHKTSVSPLRDKSSAERGRGKAGAPDELGEGPTRGRRSRSADGCANSDTRGRSTSPRMTRSQVLLKEHRESQRARSMDRGSAMGARYPLSSSTLSGPAAAAIHSRSISNARVEGDQLGPLGGRDRTTSWSTGHENGRDRSRSSSGDYNAHYQYHSKTMMHGHRDGSSRDRDGPAVGDGSGGTGKPRPSHSQPLSSRERRTQEVLQSFRHQVASRVVSPPAKHVSSSGSYAGHSRVQHQSSPEDDTSDITLEDALLRNDEECSGYQSYSAYNKLRRESGRNSKGGRLGGDSEGMPTGSPPSYSKHFRQAREVLQGPPSRKDRDASGGRNRGVSDHNRRQRETKSGDGWDGHGRSSYQLSTSPLKRAPMTKAQKRLLYGDLSADAVALGKPWTSQLRR